MDKSGRTMGFTAGLAAASTLLLAACTPPALIRYEQRGACNGFMHAGGTTNAGPKQAYVVFKVTDVSNTADKAVYHATVLERLARMMVHTLTVNPSAGRVPQHLLDKHYQRKHGANAYYGQKKE